MSSILIDCLQWYSAFILNIKKDYPFFFQTMNEICYISDCFINGKLLEPFDWDFCYCFLGRDGEYKELYDEYPHYQIQYLGLKKFLVLENKENFIKVNYNAITNPVKYRFLSIVYECNGEKVDFELSEKYYIEENEILSDLFVARYLKHHYPETPFNLSYILEIVDFDCNTITLKSNAYLLLEKTNYQIMYDETQTPLSSVDSQLFDIHKKTV